MSQKSVNNITELSQHLNLSITTVSRVLNGKGKIFRISEDTCERVLEAARQFNYSPNRIARGLKMHKSETIGLIIPDVGNPFFASVARIIETEARKNGYSLILADSLDNLDEEKELIRLLAGRKVDGIIIAPVGIESEHIEKLSDTNIPVVVIDRHFPDKPISYVSTDNYRGAYDAVKHIIDGGHKRIACIQGIKGTTPNDDRIRGYLAAISDSGLETDEKLILGNNFGEKNGYECTLNLLAMPNPPSAIFALSNLISLGVMKAAQEKNVNIPNQLSLVSYDEQPYSAFLACPMTTVDQPREKIGFRSLEILFQMINTKKGEKILIQELLPPALIIRKSVHPINN